MRKTVFCVFCGEEVINCLERGVEKEVSQERLKET